MGRILLTDATPKPRTRKSHIISKLHLCRFTNDSGKLWVYEKDRAPRPSTPRKECSERDYFEFEIDGKSTNNCYEDWFAKTETAAGTVYPKACQQLPLTERERQQWSIFIAQLFLRTRKVRLQVGGRLLRDLEPTFDTSYVADLQYDLFKQGILIPSVELQTSVRRTWAEMNSNPAFAHLAGIEHSVQNIAAAILSKNWLILDNVSGNELITSDSPVSTVKLTGNQTVLLGQGFFNRTVAVLFPLSPTKLFIASPPDTSWLSSLNADQAGKINEITARFADRNIYARSKSLSVQQLVDTEINQIEFGVNAYVPQNSSGLPR